MLQIVSPPPGAQKLRFLDLGGNIGLTACYFLSTFPLAEVCSVEPDGENFTLLQTNVSQFAARARALRAAVGAHPGRASLRPAGAAHSVTVDLLNSQGDVNVLTVSDILDQLEWDQVDVVKMDIEGSEWDIFAGPLDWLQRVRLVLIEFHGERDPAELTPLFLKQGFQLHPPGTLSGQWLLKRA
jgi:FkbM family methyltransferase